MLRISPFTPLFFNPTTDKFGIKSKYVQIFSSSDRIMIQIFTDENDVIPDSYIRNLVTETVDKIVWNSWCMNEHKIMYFHIITGLDESYYDVIIGDLACEIFKITNNSYELAETSLIQYSMKDNRQRSDVVFWIDGMRHFIDFRVPGGFKDSNWSFTVNNEQFVTSEGDIIELYSQEVTQKVFTLGNSIGCPVWFADLLNRVLCCNYVYFNGVRYARKEGSVPEMDQVIDSVNSFVFTQMLQRVVYLETNIEYKNSVAIRRLDKSSEIYRNVDLKSLIIQL